MERTWYYYIHIIYTVITVTRRVWIIYTHNDRQNVDESNEYSFLGGANTKRLNIEDNYRYTFYFPSGLLKFTFSASQDFSL